MGRRVGGGAGVGEVDPSRLREENDGMSGLPTDITRRLPEEGINTVPKIFARQKQ